MYTRLPRITYNTSAHTCLQIAVHSSTHPFVQLSTVATLSPLPNAQSINYTPSSPPRHPHRVPSSRLYLGHPALRSASVSSDPVIALLVFPLVCCRLLVPILISALILTPPLFPPPHSSPTPLISILERKHTSAAAAAFLLASSCAELVDGEPWDEGSGDAEPRVRAGPPTTVFLGSVEILGVVLAGAEERVRPGWEKTSGEDSLPQRLPMVVMGFEVCIGRLEVGFKLW